MRIFYSDTTEHFPSSAHFIEKLEEHQRKQTIEFHFFDDRRFMHQPFSLPRRMIERVRRRFIGVRELNEAFLRETARFSPDIVLIAKGAWLNRETLRKVKIATGAVLVNWMTDDPFNPAVTTRQIIASIPEYDIYTCCVRAALSDICRAGASRASFLMCGYKPAVHFPEAADSSAEKIRFQSDVVFIGAADPERADYMENLRRSMPAINIHLYGPYWERYPELRRCRYPGLWGREFRVALGESKIAINLLRTANRNDHNMRSFEVPACGGFMLANRSATHEELLKEGQEAAYFSSPAEMVDKIKYYLSNDSERNEVAQAGHRRIIQGKHSWGDRLESILNIVDQKTEHHSALISAQNMVDHGSPVQQLHGLKAMH